MLSSPRPPQPTSRELVQFEGIVFDRGGGLAFVGVPVVVGEGKRIREGF